MDDEDEIISAPPTEENTAPEVEPEGFDFEAALAEAEAEVGEGEETAEEPEVGPSPGELTTEDDAEEEDTEEGEEAEAEEEAPVALDPIAEELRALRAELAELKAPKPQAPPAPKTKSAESLQFENAVRLALFGTAEQIEKEWKNFPASIQADAQEFARIHARREVEYALNPAQRFQEQFAPMVQELLHQALAPISQERQDRKAKDLLAPYLEKLPDPKDRTALARIYADIPGANDRDLGVQKKVLDLAFEKLQWSKKEAELAAREQKAGAVERQQKAVKKARKRTVGAGVSKQAARKRVPDLKPGQDLEELYNLIASGEFELDD